MRCMNTAMEPYPGSGAEPDKELVQCPRYITGETPRPVTVVLPTGRTSDTDPKLHFCSVECAIDLLETMTEEDREAVKTTK